MPTDQQLPRVSKQTSDCWRPRSCESTGSANGSGARLTQLVGALKLVNRNKRSQIHAQKFFLTG